MKYAEKYDVTQPATQSELKQIEEALKAIYERAASVADALGGLRDRTFGSVPKGEACPNEPNIRPDGALADVHRQIDMLSLAVKYIEQSADRLGCIA